MTKTSLVLKEEVRELTISWLESNQSNGFFEGHQEEEMIFKELSDSELAWYFMNWFIEDFESGIEDEDLDEYDKMILDEKNRLMKEGF